MTSSFARALVAFTTLSLVGCAGGIASRCDEESDCRDNLVCAGAAGQERCMEPCGASDRLCDDGLVCTMTRTTTSAGEYVCFVGGTTPIGSACTESAACESGTVCANEVCQQACVFGAFPEICGDVACTASATVGPFCPIS